MSIKKKGSFEFDISLKKFRQLEKTLPKVLGNMAKEHFIEGFEKGGGQTNAGKWVPRKKQTSKPILVDTRALKRSIRVKNATFKKTTIASMGTIYGELHNEGVSPLPKREFIGNSTVLEKKLEQRIQKSTRKVFPK